MSSRSRPEAGLRPATHRRATAACLALCCAFVLQGCAGDGPSGTGASTGFDQIQREVFNVSCVSGACHNSQTLAGNLDLTQGVSYGQLVGVEPDNLVARDDGMLRVEPFVPGQSFLLLKLTGPGLGEGTQMPQGAQPLPPAQINLIRAWITAGALPGSVPTATASPLPIPTDTLAPTATQTHTAVPTGTTTATETLAPTATSTLPPSPTPTNAPPTMTGTRPATTTPTETATFTPTPSPTDTSVPTPTPSATTTPTATPSPVPTATFTIAPGSTLAEIQADIFTPRCAIPTCHTDATGLFNGDLSLAEGSSYAQLVGVEPQNLTAKRAGLLRVDAGIPDNSFILNKVTVPGLGEGSPMPLTGARLTADEVENIRAWIIRGAPPEETP